MVDVVGNAVDYTPPCPVDMVVTCEVLEHAPDWPEIIEAAAWWLRPGGRLIITCAAKNRRPHSGIDGGWKLHDGEHYAGVSCLELAAVLQRCGLLIDSMEHVAADTRASAVKPS